MKYNVISSDSHIMEPGDLWTATIEKKYRDAAPRVERKDGMDYFVCKPLEPVPVGSVKRGGASAEASGSTYKREEMRPGGWDADERLKDSAIDGVDAEVIYPTFGIVLFKIEDQPFLHSIARAYNDWIAAFAGKHPARLRAVAMLPTDDIAWARTELRRVAKLGLVGAMIPGDQSSEKGYHTPYFDPLWAVAQEVDMPMSLHVGADRAKRELDTVRYFSTYGTRPHVIAESVMDMVFSRVFERFPKLKVVSVENDVCIFANVLERCDSLYKRRAKIGAQQLAGGVLPSDVFRDHVYATFIRDRAGIKARHEIGVGNIMWSSDYPHPACTWPDSPKQIAEHFAGVPKEETYKMVCGNAMKLYRFN